MARLSDMIRQGSVPEKEKPKAEITDNDKESKMSLRNIAELKTPRSLANTQAEKEAEPAVKKMDKDFYTNLYNEAYDYVIKNSKIVIDGGQLDLQGGAKIISKMIKDLHGIELLYGKAITAKDDLDPIASNMVNVAIYAIKLGIGLKYPKEKLLSLGTCGLLHDFGMFKVPVSILQKDGKLTDKEFLEIKKHPYHGYEIIKSLGNKYLWLAEVLLQEHEREDGSGYPKKIKSESIREYAKIIALADVYEGLTHKRPQRKRLLPYDATKKILGEGRGLYAMNIVKVLLQNLGCFPLESYVKLSSQAIAKVININEKVPLRPTVEMVFDSQGNRLAERKIIKLQENTLLHIIESIYEEDLPNNDEELL